MYLFTKYYRTITDLFEQQKKLQELRQEYSEINDHWQKELKKIEGVRFRSRLHQDIESYKTSLQQEVGTRAKYVIDALF